MTINEPCFAFNDAKDSNSPQEDMLLFPDTLIWLWTHMSLSYPKFFVFSGEAAIPILFLLFNGPRIKPMNFHTRGDHANEKNLII